MHTSTDTTITLNKLLVLTVCLFGGLLIYGAYQISGATKPKYVIGQGVKYVEDPTDSLSLQSIMSLSEQMWQVETDKKVSMGLTDTPHWFKFALPKNESGASRLLEIDYALLDDVQIWFIDNGRVIHTEKAGDGLPFNQRSLAHEKFIFFIPSMSDNAIVVMRVQTDGALRLPMRVWDERRFILFAAEHSSMLGLFFGFVAAMMLSNLFFYISSGSRTFLYYACYVLFMGLAVAMLHGVGYKYLWPESTWIQGKGISFFTAMATFFALAFSLNLLEVKKHSEKLFTGLKFYMAVCIALAIASLFLSNYWNIRMLLPMLFVAIFIFFTVGIFSWVKGVKMARYYTTAWAILLVSGLLTSLENAGVVILDVSSNYLLMFGASVETFLLALTLAISYAEQREALYESQENALQTERQARASQEEIIRLKEEAQHELEYKVQERTLELEIALRELSETNQELERKNTIDSLTGLRNRRFFDKKLQAEIRRSRREQTPLTLVMIDIDHFKSINDQHGHMVGDECIRKVSEVITSKLKRPADEASRYGGEEFALILPATDLQGAEQVTESIRAEISSVPVPTAAGNIALTISAGICSTVIADERHGLLLLEQADQQLYAAKRAGRDRVMTSSLNVTDTPQALN